VRRVTHGFSHLEPAHQFVYLLIHPAHGFLDQIGYRFVLAVSPEGSRDKVGCWKSGFYYIAQHAGMPIGLGFLDYPRRRCGVGGFMQPTGDLRADMDSIRNFYKGIQGKFPAKQCIPRLREEDGEFSLGN
jgi:hypothetical protein